MPTPPVLLDVEQDGRQVPAVLLTGKQSLLFLFDRLTGEPLNGFVETPIPRTNLPGIEPWPTQPFPEAPGPLARTTMTRDEIPDLVPGMKEHCEAIWDEHDILPGVLYSLPRADRATLNFPGATGGPNWGGGAYSPELDVFYISLQNRGRFSLPVTQPSGFLARQRSTEVLPETPTVQGAGGGGGQRNRVSFSYELEDGTVLPCSPTPWGELVAVSIADRSIKWRAPLGDFDSVPGEDTGTYNLGGSMATAGGLVFVGASNDRRFRAFDARTGAKLWETELEASAHATPITYTGADGRQYVVVAAGGGTSVGGPVMSDTIVAFALPSGERNGGR
jgi:quinoprotein glucose dehydrogenase